MILQSNVTECLQHKRIDLNLLNIAMGVFRGEVRVKDKRSKKHLNLDVIKVQNDADILPPNIFFDRCQLVL